MGWLKDVAGFEKFNLKHTLKKIKDEPWRLAVGSTTGVGTKLWNEILNRDDKPLVDNWGGAPKDSYHAAQAQGINTKPGHQAHQIARTVTAAMFGANAMGGGGGGAEAGIGGGEVLGGGGAIGGGGGGGGGGALGGGGAWYNNPWVKMGMNNAGGMLGKQQNQQQPQQYFGPVYDNDSWAAAANASSGPMSPMNDQKRRQLLAAELRKGRGFV